MQRSRTCLPRSPRVLFLPVLTIIGQVGLTQADDSANGDGGNAGSDHTYSTDLLQFRDERLISDAIFAPSKHLPSLQEYEASPHDGVAAILESATACCITEAGMKGQVINSLLTCHCLTSCSCSQTMVVPTAGHSTREHT